MLSIIFFSEKMIKSVLFTLLVIGCTGLALGQEKLIRLEEKYNDKKYVKDKLWGIINRNVDPNKTTTYVVEYNFGDGVYIRNNLSPRVDVPIVFNITNINRQAYDITIKVQDSVLASSNIEDLSSWFIGKTAPQQVAEKGDNNKSHGNDVGITDNDLSNKVKEKTADGKLKDTVNKVLAETKTIEKIEQKVDLLNLKKDSLDFLVRELNIARLDSQKIRNDIQSLASLMQDTTMNDDKKKENDAKITTLIRQVDSLYSLKFMAHKVNQISRLEAQIIILNDSISTMLKLKNETLLKFAQDSREFLNAYGDLSRLYAVLYQFLSDYKDVIDVCHDPNLTLLSYQLREREKMEKIRLGLPGVRDAIKKFDESATDIQVRYSQLFNNSGINDLLNYGGRIKLYAHVDKVKSLADKMIEQVKEIKFDPAITFISHRIPELDKETNYSFISYPIQAKNDVALFDVSISKKKQHDEPAAIVRKFSHAEYTRGGIRFDVSIGLAGGIFPHVKTYDMYTTDSSARIVQKSKHTYVPSLIGLFTVGFRSAGYCTFGLSGGMGVDVNQAKIELGNFYAGPSLTLGKHNRMTVAGGFAIRSVDVLRAGHSESDSYPANKKIEDVTTKQTKVGYFLAVSYNLTKGMKDNIKYLSGK